MGFCIKRLNEKGFSWHFALPIVAIVGVASVGTYLLTQSHAATACYSQQWSPGSSGQCVKDIQTMVNDISAVGIFNCPNGNWGYTLTVDGQYGTNTKSVVGDMQIVYNNQYVVYRTKCAPGTSVSRISVDGVVGKQSWALLCTYAYHNDLGAAVTAAGKNAGCP